MSSPRAPEDWDEITNVEEMPLRAPAEQAAMIHDVRRPRTDTLPRIFNPTKVILDLP